MTQLRYDMRKLRGHGLLERVGKSYSYRLTDKGRRVCLFFTLFHQRVCGPLANGLFGHSPQPFCAPCSKLENAYRKADKSIQHILELLAA